MNSDSHTMPALLTYEDYFRIPEDGNRYEVIDGVLTMCPSPVLRHQRISNNVSYQLTLWAKQTTRGSVWCAPLDVLLSDQDIVQPDILYVADVRASILREKYVQGAPDLIVEILSEGSRRHDEVVKRELYEAHGVTEYWIVDPVLETIKVYRLEEERYRRFAELSRESGGELTSPLLPGFRCTLTDVFE